MSWAIQVENLSKQYRMGTAVTPAFDSVYQIVEQKFSSLARRISGANTSIEVPAHHEPSNPSAHLVLTPEQQEGCPEGHFWGLRDVSFEIKEGERVGIVGKNGSGKSTLLKILSRITTPTKGQFRFRGRLVSLLEVGTGFHPDLSGRENIILNAKINGMSSKAIRRIYDKIVDFSELGPQIDTPIKRYSSGMYMRLAFSVAAHLESEILIVDEVLAVGDAGFQKKCLDKMLEISGRGRTLLFVSHDMNAISSLCTKALELSHGQVVDSPHLNGNDLIFEQNSLGSPNLNGNDLIFEQNSQGSPHLNGNDLITEQNSQGLRSVDQAIKDYVLGKTSAERLWDRSNAPRMANKDVILKRVAVVNSSREVSDRFDVSEDVRVVVQFDSQADKLELNVHVYITTLTGQRLLVSMDNLDIPKYLRSRPKGEFRETCLINRDLLNQGTYRVEVVVCTNPTSENYISVPDVVSFAITDNLQSLAVRGDWVREWPDYPIRSRFIWDIEQLKMSF
jgi:lipopolysaccharide transport system ATP-binding protein